MTDTQMLEPVDTKTQDAMKLAEALARMAERAKRVKFKMLKSGELMVTTGKTGKWKVRLGRDGVTYCTCPSWKYGAGYCKHLEAAKVQELAPLNKPKMRL